MRARPRTFDSRWRAFIQAGDYERALIYSSRCSVYGAEDAGLPQARPSFKPSTDPRFERIALEVEHRAVVVMMQD